MTSPQAMKVAHLPLLPDESVGRGGGHQWRGEQRQQPQQVRCPHGGVQAVELSGGF